MRSSSSSSSAPPQTTRLIAAIGFDATAASSTLDLIAAARAWLAAPVDGEAERVAARSAQKAKVGFAI